MIFILKKVKIRKNLDEFKKSFLLYIVFFFYYKDELYLSNLLLCDKEISEDEHYTLL